MSLNDKGICPQELIKQSDARFGIVRDGESLARFLSPLNIKSGKVHLNFLTIEDLRKDGWSFVRWSHTDKNRLHDIRNLVKGKSSRDVGYAKIQVSAIRGILDENENQTLCVLDDTQDFEEHALVKESNQREPAKAREIRNKLIDILQIVKP